MAFGIANSNDVEIIPLPEAIDQLDFEVLYTRTNWFDPEIQDRLRKVEKYEILVPDCVPRKLIKVIF